MTSLRERLLAKKAGGTVPPVVENESVKKSLHPESAPVSPPKQDKPSTQAVNQSASQGKAAPTVRPNKALSGGAASLLQKAREATQNAAPTVSASDLAAKVQKVKDAEVNKPVPTSNTVKPSTPKLGGTKQLMPNKVAAQVNELSKAILDDEQSEAVNKLEGLDADTMMEGLLQLEDYLLGDAPQMPTFMREIHRNLKQYPELTHILNEKQIGLVVQSIIKRKGVEVVTPSNPDAKGRTNVKNLTRNMSKDDIMNAL